MDSLFGIQIFGLLFCFGNALITSNQTIIVEKGERVMLPCTVSKNMGENEAIVWIRNETSILYIDYHLLPSNNYVANIKLEGDNYTLVIANFSSSSNGLYTCRLAVALNSVSYYVRMKEPPIVKSIEGETVIEIGDDLNLNCITQGFPAPNITWYRQKTLLSQRESFHNEKNIHFENVSEKISGMYTCVASYEDKEDSKSVNAVVFDGIKAESKRVYAEPPGEDTKLCCLFNKTKEISWLKQGRNITCNDRITEETTKHKSCLIINQVEFQDFGAYLCLTTNFRQVATIDLTGIPKHPLLISNINNSISWKIINSVFPVQEYTIFIKNTRDIFNSWKFIAKKEITTSDKKEFIVSYSFSDIPSGNFDVKLEVANTIGDNEVINYNIFINTTTSSTSTRTVPKVYYNSAAGVSISLFCLALTILNF